MKVKSKISDEKNLSNNNSDNINNNKSKNNKDKRKKLSYWTLKITIITFFLSAFFSFFSEITTTHTGIVIAGILLIILVLINIIFDGIAVSVTSCDLAPLLSLASRKVPASKIAVRLVKNAEKVSNICADVIGDVCGIISGACAVAIVSKFIAMTNNTKDSLITIILSSIVAAITVGGKAYLKEVAIKNSKDMVMFTARLLNIFIKDK